MDRQAVRRRIPLSLCTCLILSQCAPPEIQISPNTSARKLFAPGMNFEKKQIHVFFDGTSNNWATRTNIRRSFEMISSAEDPKTPSFYCDGVGNGSLSGMVLGVGMKERIRAAYRFLSENYSSDQDDILVFGFSRGAFQARVMAGLIGFCGLIDGTKLSREQSDVIFDELWAYCADYLHEPKGNVSAAEWNSVMNKSRSAVASVFCKRYPGIAFKNPRIRFLGLWDTVPGLRFTKIDESNGMTGQHGTHFKVRPYPNIDVIAHALALDEKRSNFSPLLVGPPLDPSRTKVYEVWFPGAHSDIGGGYSDSNDVSGITLNWINSILRSKGIPTTARSAYQDAESLSHHPESVFPNNAGSEKKNRILRTGSVVDKTVFLRALADTVPETDRPGKPIRFLSYRPVIHLNDGSEVRIRGTRDSAEMKRVLGPNLVLNDSSRTPSQQIELRGTPLLPSKSQVPVADVKEQSVRVLVSESTHAAGE